MRHAARRAVWCWAVLCIGCGDSGGGGDDTAVEGEPCEVGVVYECFGNSGCQGRRICSSGFLTSCRCDEVPPGPVDSGAPGDDDAGTVVGAVDAAVDADASLDAGRDGATEEDGGDDSTSTCDCVSDAPGGWDGPVLVYEGTGTVPACGGAYSDQVVEGGTTVSGDPASCSTCDCSGTGTCGTALGFESGGLDATCGGGCLNSVTASCALLSPSCIVDQPTTWLENHPPTNAGDGCTPSAQSPSVPTATWDANVRACAPPAALERDACDGGEVCAPEGPFHGALCVYQAGDVSCPGSGYSDRHVYFTAIADTRDCSACGCGVDCGYTWNVYDVADTTCTSPIASLSEPGQCIAVTPSGDSIRVGADIASPTAACEATGGQPVGSVDGSGPITFCCVP